MFKLFVGVGGNKDVSLMPEIKPASFAISLLEEEHFLNLMVLGFPLFYILFCL